MENNISEKLEQLINSPGGMDKIRAAAAALLGNAEQGTENKKEAEDIVNTEKLSNISDLISGISGNGGSNTGGMPDLSGLLGNIGSDTGKMPDLSGLLGNTAQIGSIIKVLGAVNSMKSDSRIDLINSLKPYLSEERAKRADKAISFLKISAILPLIKEEGLLNLF